MPALKPTEFIAKITFLGAVADREAQLASNGLSEINATFAGFSGEAHGGFTRLSCSRVQSQYELGTEIRNTRQFSVVSAEELAAIAAEMGLSKVDPRWLGASIVLDGIDDFSHVPPSSRLQFPSGATLVVDMENRPCVLPAKEIDKDYAGFGRLFKPAAEGRRGVTTWVEREGIIRVGDTVRLHIPDQPRWKHQPS
jgi:MOSC domain-containing protein